MDRKLFLVFLLPYFHVCCNRAQKDGMPKTDVAPKTAVAPKSREVVDKATIDTVFLGDVDSDKITDTAFVYTPPTLATYDENGNLEYTFGCVENDCFNQVRFSCSFPDIRIENSVWGTVENAGDLDADGVSEILFSRGWFIGSSNGLELYGFKNGRWTLLAKAIYRDREGETLKSHLVKKGKKYFLKGYKAVDGDEVDDLQPVNFRGASK